MNISSKNKKQVLSSVYGICGTEKVGYKMYITPRSNGKRLETLKQMIEKLIEEENKEPPKHTDYINNERYKIFKTSLVD